MQKSTVDNELIERYLYDVTRRLPEKQRQDIEEELRTLIEDMLEERQENEKDAESNIKDVLEELGEPAKLAAKYRGEDAHLIGGEYYPLYCQILKVVLICVGAGVAVSAIVSFFITASTESMDGIIRSVQDGFISLAEIPMALIQTFGVVTLFFFLLEKYQVKLQGAVSWDVSRLPQIPCKKAVIPKGDSITGIVFSILIAIIFICAPEFMGAWVKGSNGELVAVSVFNLSIWNRVLPLFLIAFFMGVVDGLVQLIVGYYNLTVMCVNIACNLISMVVTIILFKGYELWNSDFVKEISSITGETFSGEYDIMAHWNTGFGNGMHWSDIFLAAIICFTMLDMGITVYRTLRYGLKGNR
ncbi:MAG: HAAS signaling domain-containing protein [Lachnospiraceae bacterium]